MNNKEKRKYISDLLAYLSTPFMSEIETRKDFLRLTPTILYKYRSFDEHTFEMIEEDYSFLTPVKGLDDPFDCLNDFDTSEYYDKKTQKITPKAVDFIIKMVCPNGLQDLSTKEVRNLAMQCIDENGIDFEKAPKIVRSNGITTIMEIEPVFIMFDSFNENFKNILQGAELDGFAKSAKDPGDRVGVCSLSETRDNKVMWSLYSNVYKGYCIEYEVPKRREATSNLCPVIYTKRSNNSFIEKMLEYFANSMLRSISNGNIKGNIGASMELFCTKDSDWSYQREWRLFGKAKDHFKYLKIKAIYLGFKVSKENETEMIRCAKEHKFKLFKMNQPNGKKKIEYTPIFIPD